MSESKETDVILCYWCSQPYSIEGAVLESKGWKCWKCVERDKEWKRTKEKWAAQKKRAEFVALVYSKIQPILIIACFIAFYVGLWLGARVIFLDAAWEPARLVIYPLIRPLWVPFLIGWLGYWFGKIFASVK